MSLPDSHGRNRTGVDLNTEIDTTGRTGDRRSDFDVVYGGGGAARAGPGRSPGRVRAVLPVVFPRRVPGGARRAGPRRAESTGLADVDYLALLTAEGPDLDALADLAHRVRKDTVGDDVGYVVSRNINFTNVCYIGCRFCAFA